MKKISVLTVMSAIFILLVILYGLYFIFDNPLILEFAIIGITCGFLGISVILSIYAVIREQIRKKKKK